MASRLQAPLISIALCTYNGASYLGAQLESLLGQRYENFEVIAVDDGSSDETCRILKDYALRDSRFRVVENPINLGFRRNFAIALAQCSGELIAPCDQDDIWLPDKLSLLHQALGNATMSYCDSALMAADGKLLGKSMSDLWYMKDLTDPMAFVVENCVSGHAMLFRRELLLSALPIPDGFFHDWWLVAVAAASGGVVFCPEALVHYRQHAANVTDVLRKRQRSARTSDIKLTKWREIAARITALATLDSPSQPLLRRLEQLWRVRYRQWVCWTLFSFAVQHRKELWSMRHRSVWQRFTLPFRFIIGMRWQRVSSAIEDSPVD